MSALRFAAIALLALLLCSLIWKSLPARTPTLAGPNPISQLIEAEIGGMTQWILIRGTDRSAPILLWLHGGPGAAQMPIHAVTAGLERDFVVVHWDQRGAGKSNPANFDQTTMTFEQFLSDAYEVTTLLRERIGSGPIIVLGHSWGTMLGARLVARWPREYAGYIGVGQHVNTLRGATLSRDWLHEVAPSDLTRLEPQSFHKHDLYVRLMQEVEAQGGGMNVSLVAMMQHALVAPEYRLSDYRRWVDGANRGSGSMWPEYVARDLIVDVPEMPVTMLLIAGASDWNTPTPLVRDWFEAVEAPNGKRMEVFDASGHAPFLTETARFMETARGFAVEIAMSPE